MKQLQNIWLALVTHPHREAYAIANLERQNLEAYCPMIMKRIRHARRAYDAPRPLFPGYVFVAERDARFQWRPLGNTLGVRSVVMSGERPARLPLGFIENLKEREVDGCVLKPQTPFYLGQEVKIQSGALDGLIGRIIELRENDRVTVLLDLLKQQVRVSVEAKMLA